MKVYRVGGSVRDELLGLPVQDQDYVVVGAVPEDLLSRGFIAVGKDFPVFLHPKTKEEYALARTERKVGKGYRGFAVHASPEVSLEEDLARRDLTINAIAMDAEGRLFDPYGGVEDLKRGILRHVGPAFAEDPLRVLRVARFHARFGFAIAPETLDLMREIASSGELSHLTKERVWQEISRGLMEAYPSRMFYALRDCCALDALLPEVAALFGVPQSPLSHPEIDAGVHTMMALDWAAFASMSLPVRLAVLLHDLGKGVTPRALWPRHPGHEKAGARLAKGLAQRLGTDAFSAELAIAVARWHGIAHRGPRLSPRVILMLLRAVDALRRPERFLMFLGACAADSRGRKGFEHVPYLPAPFWQLVFLALKRVPESAIAASEKEKKNIPGAIEKARLQAISRFKEKWQRLYS